MRKSVMRNGSIAVACGFLIAGCASTPEEAAPVGPPPNVAFYNAAPTGSTLLGPIKVSLCNGTRPVVTRKLLEEAARLGGNGIIQLTCRTDSTSSSCSHTAECEGMAINVPPLPPPGPARRAPRR